MYIFYTFVYRFFVVDWRRDLVTILSANILKGSWSKRNYKMNKIGLENIQYFSKFGYFASNTNWLFCWRCVLFLVTANISQWWVRTRMKPMNLMRFGNEPLRTYCNKFMDLVINDVYRCSTFCAFQSIVKSFKHKIWV